MTDNLKEPQSDKDIKLWDAAVEYCNENHKGDDRKYAACHKTFLDAATSEAAREYWEGQRSRPKIVCLCGSTRFMDAFQQANLKLTCEGMIVLSVGCNTKSDRDLLFSGELTPELKIRLDELHKRKIDLADEIFVLNVDGYVGESTRSEIEYAEAAGKPVRYLEPLPAPPNQ